MKSTLLSITLSILLFVSPTQLKAQDNSTKYETLVNEQFGTLLESLLTNGKLDEDNAKTYLETVFGYDEAVSNYLQTAKLSKQVTSVQQGNMSFDNYISAINSSLLSLIPQEQKQAYESYMNGHMMMQGSMSELTSGQIGENTVALASGIAEGIKDNKEEKIRNEAIAKKLEVITPTLTKLNSSTRAYNKLKITDEVTSDKNWVINTNPPVRDKKGYSIVLTTNYSTLQNGYLLVNTQNYVQAIFNWDKSMVFDPMRIYKNIEKFDFSKDFTMNIYLKTGKKDGQYIDFNIGKGYKISIYRTAGNLTIVTPTDYCVSEKYGELKTNTIKSKQAVTIIDKQRYIFQGQNWGGYNGSLLMFKEKKNPDIDFNGILKFTITKNGDVFTCKFNDLPYELNSTINYFPDKYYLGMLVSEFIGSKKCFAEIHKLELEHL